jgi:beta-galactosidase
MELPYSMKKYMNNKSCNLIILSAVFFLMLITESFSYLSAESLKILMPSEKRYVADLSGNWDRSVDMSEWTAVNLPRSEKIDGKVIYKRIVKIPAGMTDNYSWQLYFLGIDHQIEVYWNEQFIGRYVGAMAPFFVKIPEKTVRNDANEIRLVVLPSEGKIKQIRSQQLNSRQYFTGLIRDVLIVGTPQVWISDIKYTTKIKSTENADLMADISISSTEVKNLIKKLISKDSITIKTKDKLVVSISADLKKHNSSEVLGTTTSKSIAIESDRTIIEGLALNCSGINLWSPETPEIYDLVIKIKRNDLVIDDYTVTVGFRNVVTASTGDGSSLLLNGQTLKLKGISYVEDLKGVGQTLSEYQIKQDIAQIKKLGANVVRSKFNSPHPLFVHYCNISGLMLMVELPLYDVPSSITNLDEVKIHMQNLAKQFVTRYNNAPSVIAWGIGAGVDEDAVYYKNYSESMLKLFSRDSDKLKYKLVPHGCKEIFTDGFDFIGYSDIRKNADFVQINAEFKRIQGLIKGKPLFMTYGAEVQLNNHNGYSDPLSVEFQAYSILNSFKIVEKNKGAGSVINTFNDYLQNKPSLTTDNQDSYINTSGLMDRSRNERLSFATLQALFNNEKEPILNAGSFNQTIPISYLIIGIGMAVLLVLLINRFRRFREYMFRSLLRPYNFYADIRDQRIISSIQTLLLGVIISLSLGIFLSSILYYYKDSEVLEYLLMMLLPSNGLKEFVYTLVWMPEVSLFLIALISYSLAFLTGWIIRIIAILTRARVFWSDCMTISIWAALPSIILLPLSIIVMRLIVLSPGTVWFFLTLYFITSIWTVARLLKSISVVFDIPSIRAYLIGGTFMVICVVAPLGYYHVKYSFFEYWSYYSNILLN